MLGWTFIEIYWGFFWKFDLFTFEGTAGGTGRIKLWSEVANDSESEQLLLTSYVSWCSTEISNKLRNPGQNFFFRKLQFTSSLNSVQIRKKLSKCWYYLFLLTFRLPDKILKLAQDSFFKTSVVLLYRSLPICDYQSIIKVKQSQQYVNDSQSQIECKRSLASHFHGNDKTGKFH